MSEIIGFDNVVKLYENFKGSQINFPTRLFSKEFVLEEALKAYDGTSESINLIATKYSYSERTIRKLLKNHIFIFRRNFSVTSYHLNHRFNYCSICFCFDSRQVSVHYKLHTIGNIHFCTFMGSKYLYFLYSVVDWNNCSYCRPDCLHNKKEKASANGQQRTN